jgi:hypothetical protein
MNNTKCEGSSRVEAIEEKGISVPTKDYSLQKLAELKKTAETMIDDFMRKVGIKDPQAQTDDSGWRVFTCGSATGRAGIVDVEHDLYLRVEALIMPLPSDKELILPLMRDLLDINAVSIGPTRMAIINENVVCCAMLAVDELDENHFYGTIHATMMLADNLDDQLTKKYGGTSLKRKA